MTWIVGDVNKSFYGIHKIQAVLPEVEKCVGGGAMEAANVVNILKTLECEEKKLEKMEGKVNGGF